MHYGRRRWKSGYLRSTVIEALSNVLYRHAEWCTSEACLLEHMETFSLLDAWEAMAAGRGKIFQNTAKSDVAGRLEKHFLCEFSSVKEKVIS